MLRRHTRALSTHLCCPASPGPSLELDADGGVIHTADPADRCEANSWHTTPWPRSPGTKHCLNRSCDANMSELVLADAAGMVKLAMELF